MPLLPSFLATIETITISAISSILTFQPLKPVRRLVSNFNVNTPDRAHKVAALIPGQCPFERDLTVLGYCIGHIPPLCKLNPFYNELVELRFRALCYLAEECGEDISVYI
ncbi:MAG: Mo-dependent nitrogenase [Cyanobacteria bacterium REEB459]|nr:Mo-dependent nitrogenase [Cyanobacteria bacterium REEB459]